MLAVKKDDIVAVVLARKPETIVAFLAISKAGAAFLPIDPTLPTARIEQQISLSQSKVAIVNHKNSHQLSNNIEAIIIDGDDAPQHNVHVASDDLDISIAENDLAYVLFTSGSTGVPKGVLIEHGALSKRLNWLAKTFNFMPNDIALQSIQLSFDPALIEICLPLTQGAQVALPAEGKVAPTDLAALADHFDATHIIFVPTTLRYFNQTVDAYPDLKLRVAISGGEVLPTKMAKQFVQKTGAQLYNLYGPTEGCIFASAHKFNPKETTGSVPIGSPVDDTRIYILDKNLALLPEGIMGEVYIGGSAIARGYLNDEQLTKTQFVADPFLKKQRIYKTGDLGYWDKNGYLQFVSRIDDQMKLRGQRIAPQEVEAALLAAVEIQSAAVKLVNQTLHAWLVLDPKANCTLDDELKQTIRTRISSMLPAYMVPQFFNQIMVMPQQSSGKIEYKALTPQFTSDAKTLKPAKNQLEETLLSLFKTTLSNNDIGTDCHFYELGADSISSLTLLTNINQTIGETLALSTLLANPTVEMLALKLSKNEQSITVDLNEDQQQIPIYIAASGHGDIMRFKPLGILLNKLFTLKMLQPPITKNNIAHDKTTIEALANEYANEIISQEQLAPPIIAGFSVGGITAFETARILIDRGIKIKGIVLIDTTYPKLFLRLPWLWRVSSWLVNALGLHELSINQRQLGTLFGDQGLQTQIKALSHYTPTALDIPTTLIISSGFKPWYRYIFKPWRKLQKQNLDEKHVSGFHGTLFAPEHIDSLANSIRKIDFER
jgi:amino acid adenylation domain